jgi:uncharacterized membrane protein YqjE
MEGIGGAARQVLADAVDLGRLRLELAAVELEEERHRLARLALGAALTVLLGLVAVLLACAWLVLASPPEHRVALLGGLVAASAIATAVVGWRWRQLAASKPPLLQHTLEQLHRDGQALKGEPG